MRYAIVIAVILTLVLPATSADSAKTLYNKGRDAEFRQDYEAAYDFYSQAWNLKPKELKYRTAASRTRFLAAASYVHRGQLLKDDGKLDEALLLFEKAAVLDPSSFIAQQEIKRTKELIEKRKGGGAQSPPATSELTKRVQEAGGPVDLAPIAETPITLHLTEDSKVIYETIGKLAGINVLFDPDYTSRRIKIDLQGVTLNEALDILALQSKTFWRPVTSNTIFVAADTTAKRKELEQSVIKTFYLSNLSQPTELQDVVNAMRTILEVSRIQQLPSQSAIIVRGTPDQVALAEKLVGDIDKARPEVIVEVAIMQVRRDKLQDLGISPPGSASIGLAPNVTSGTTTTTGSNVGTGSGSVSQTTGTPNQINLNTLANINATNFVVTIPPATANFLFNDTTTKILQNPQIRASDGQKASLKIGDRVPVATGSFQPGIGGVGINPLVNTQFQYIDVGVNIDMTPKVHAGREVTLKLMIDVSSVTSHVNIGGIDQPVIGQRKIEHEIRLKEGEVNLLGGIFEDDTVKGLAGIPGLGQIPLFKYLFASEHTELHQNEIVFVLIPHIVRLPEVSDLNQRAIDVGTGTAIDLHRVKNGSQPGPQSKLPTQTPSTAPPTPVVPQPIFSAQPGAAQPQSGSPTPQPASPAGPRLPGGGAMPQSSAQPAQPAAGAPSQVGFTFDPAAANPVMGSTFAMNVVLTGGQDISTVPLQINYDPKIMQLANISNGGLLSQDGQPVALVHRDDPSTGTLQVSATRPPGMAGITGSGAVVTLTFVAKAPGTGTLMLGNPLPRNSASQVVPATPASATVTVK